MAKKREGNSNVEIKVSKGQLCKIRCDALGEKGSDRVMQFSHRDGKGFFHFVNYITGTSIILLDDTEFQTLPLKEGLKFLIDLSLETNDQEWFKQLTNKLEYECDFIESTSKQK